MTNISYEKLLLGTTRINEAGHLEIAGCDTIELAKEHGTPLICYDEALIRDNCRRYIRSFVRGSNRVAYAGKAFLSIALCQILEEEGLYLDVVSGGELYTALKANFPPERIYFHGNNKTKEEIVMAMQAGVGHFVVDNLLEYSMLKEVAQQAGNTLSILFRVALGVDAATHKYIQTGQHDSKFGFAIQSKELDQVIADAVKTEFLVFEGFHSHIGSQITSLGGFKQAVEVMFELVNQYRQAHGWTPAEISFGGGLGVNYLPVDESSVIEDLSALILQCADEQMANLRVSPRLVIEPGRSIVGQAGTTLYSVGSMKTIPGIRNYVAVDGGMTDNPRPALYQAKYTCMLANKATEKISGVYSIAGRCCESGDMLIWDHPLPLVESGDILAVFVTGAYNYSMASNYNRLPKPAVVLAQGGQSRVIIQRETYDDLVRLDKSLR